jgi:hypothetical protein
MNGERDFEQLVRAWVSEGADAAPERFVWAAIGQIETTPQRGRWRRIIRGSSPGRRFAPQVLGVVAVLAIATLTYVFASRPVDLGPGPSPSPTAAPSATPLASPSPSVTVAPSPSAALSTRRVSPAAAIDIGGRPWQLRATDDAIWASVAEQLVRIDPATNQVAERIDVPGAGSSCPDCTGGDGGSWSFAIDGRDAWVSFHVDGASMVRRLDLDGGVVADIPIEPNGGDDVAVGFGSVWVAACHTSQVVRIDPTSNVVSGTIAAEDPPSLGDCNAMYLGIGADTVWTAFGGGDFGRESYVVRIDPVGLTRSASHPRSGPTCGPIAVGAGDLWVSACPGLEGRTITHLDPVSGAEVGSARMDGYPGQPVIVGDLVWVPVASLSGGSLTLVAIDRATGSVVDTVDPGATVQTRYSSAASAVTGFDSVWVNGTDGALLRISRDDLVP